MAELEEGELPSDGEEAGETAAELAETRVAQAALHMPVQSFRSSKLPVYRDSSSEDSSGDSDDSSNGWKSKRKKKKEEVMDTIDAPTDSRHGNFKMPTQTRPPTRKVNNIWGAVLQEQTLSHTMIGLGVDKLEGDLQMDRDVESYDYTRAKTDCRTNMAALVDTRLQSNDPFDSVIDPEPHTNNRGIKRRWNHKVDTKMSQPDTDEKVQNIDKLNLSESENRILTDIVTELDEPNVELFGRMVQVLGEEKVLELLKLTKEKEADGGILTFNKERRRTPGGVYIYLLKTDPGVEKEQIKKIFYEDICQKNREQRAKYRRSRKNRKKKPVDFADEIKKCLENKAEEIRKKLGEEAEKNMTEAEIRADSVSM